MFDEMDAPHEYIPYDGDSDFYEPGECETCGRPGDHPLHGQVEIVAPHPFSDATLDGSCAMCGLPAADAVHAEEGVRASNAMPTATVEPTYDEPHGFILVQMEDADSHECDCGRSKEDRMHVLLASGGDKLQRFRIPLLIPEGISSGDGRTFAQGALSSRNMPLALMWQPEGDEGHKGSVIVGRIDHVERTEQGLGNAYGVFDSGTWGQEALRLVKGGMLRGVSADLDEFEASLVEEPEEAAAANKISSTKILVNAGRLMGATLVAKPAFAECYIELVNDGEDDMTDGEYTAESGESIVAALIASAAPLHPPTDWFENPGLSKPTALTVTDEGRVFGHIASWDIDHIGLPFGTRAPRSKSNYAYFRTGVLRTAEGNDIPVGQLTLSGGHAPLSADARAAVKHYDDTASAVADLAAGEDQFGIWVSGALRPGVTPEQVRAMRAAAPSGDWRPIRGGLELVAVCQVNVPGFPIARAMVAGGQVTALVAAGALAPSRYAEMTSEEFAARIEALEAAEQRRLAERAAQLSSRVAPSRERRDASLVAAAEAARARITAVRTEKEAPLVSKKEELQARVASLGYGGVAEFRNFDAEQRKEFAKKGWALPDGSFPIETVNDLKNALRALGRASDRELAVQHIKKRARQLKAEKLLPDTFGVTEFRADMMPGDGEPFDEAKHPRDRKGKFRQVIARLSEILNPDEAPEAANALARINDAADAEDAGDAVGADEAARESADALDAAAEVANESVKAALHEAAKTVRDAVEGDAPGGEHDEGIAEIIFDELTQEAKELVEEAVEHAEQQLDPANPDELFRKVKAFITGTNAMDPNDVANFVKNQLKREVSPSLFDVSGPSATQPTAPPAVAGPRVGNGPAPS